MTQCDIILDTVVPSQALSWPSAQAPPIRYTGTFLGSAGSAVTRHGPSVSVALRPEVQGPGNLQ